FRLAQFLGRDGLVEAHGERPVFGATRLVAAAVARPQRLAGLFGLAHFAVIGHFGAGRVGGVFGTVLQFVAGRIGLIELHLLHVFGIGRLALLSGFVLAPI